MSPGEKYSLEHEWVGSWNLIQEARFFSKDLQERKSYPPGRGLSKGFPFNLEKRSSCCRQTFPGEVHFLLLNLKTERQNLQCWARLLHLLSVYFCRRLLFYCHLSAVASDNESGRNFHIMPNIQRIYTP